MDNVIENKSFNFAVRIVNLCRYLAEKKSEYVLSKQLLRSGTSTKQSRFYLKNEYRFESDFGNKVLD